MVNSDEKIMDELREELFGYFMKSLVTEAKKNKSLFEFCNCIKCGNLKICKYAKQFKTEAVGYNPSIDLVDIDVTCKKFREQTTTERGSK